MIDDPIVNIRLVALMQSNLSCTRYARTSDDRSGNQTENSVPLHKPMSIGPLLKPTMTREYSCCGYQIATAASLAEVLYHE